ncbi:MAG: class I SAM-dependent methyltransferase [Oscillospiraceae bacterium]|nr:class I SAM-dependent methyltransferase [Oscillospiraceae bacterium]
MSDAHKNAGRFMGFAGAYNAVRPACPQYVVEILTRYLGRRPETVVDLGCGTGLSTFIWSDAAGRVIGIEPSADMLAEAMESAKQLPNVVFGQAFSDNIGLESGIADIVTCSQSFHWMEPVSTLREVRRLLKPGGVFAAYDCDWPPACCADVDLAYQLLFEKVYQIEREDEKLKKAFIQYPKNRHLENMRISGAFRYIRELVFASVEASDVERFIGIALSQSRLRAVLKQSPTLIEEELAMFHQAVERHFGSQTRRIDFCYRMRIGVV